jgi:hypothetical protein
METAALIRLLNALKAARDASDWRGRFTSEIRNATASYRFEHIAKPLDEAIAELQKELDSRPKKCKRRRLRVKRLPYRDD